jgi:hypothetical protein
MKTLDDLSIPQQIAVLRDAAKALRTGGQDAEVIKPEYRNELADMCEDNADRLEAGEDPFEDEEESPEQLDAIRKIVELLKQENVGSLRELLKRHGVVFEEDLN